MKSITIFYKKVEIFTDGSCLGNPGPGGYAALLRFQNQEKIIKNGFFYTTNNRMELMAIIMAFKTICYPHCYIILHTDSQYVQQGITKWIHCWKKKTG